MFKVKDDISMQELAKMAVTNWYGYQNPMELEFAARIVKEHQPKVIVEIGMAYGASLVTWKIAAGNPEIAIGIDPYTIQGNPDQLATRDIIIKQYEIETIRRISRYKETHEDLVKLLKGRKVDFLFIDGNHGYDDARHDFFEYKKYLAPNALVGFHDIYYSDTLVDAGSTCCLFWDRMKRDYENYDEIIHSSMGIGIIHFNSYKWGK